MAKMISKWLFNNFSGISLATAYMLPLLLYSSLMASSVVANAATPSLPTPPKLTLDLINDQENISAIKKVVATYKESPLIRTLPLASHWNGGESNILYSPAYQIDLIKNGAYILPWISLHPPGEYYNPAYYSKLIRYACDNNLPITILSTQWEYLLSSRSEFTKLPPPLNPNTFNSLGLIQKFLRVDGRPSDWYRAGQIWSSSGIVQYITSLCPNPTLVLFLSNNEQPKQEWADAIYKAEVLMGRKGINDDESIKKIFGDKWIALYSELIKGFRDGLPENWRSASRFIGYNAFSDAALGRWPGWASHTLYTKGRIEPWMEVFEGASADYYLYDGSDISDFMVYSPQIESMNYLPVLTTVIEKHPKFWFEVSIWDGYEPAKNGGKRAFYKKINQTFDECRYQGYIRFGAWLLRPRILREYRGSTDYTNETYFNTVLNVVDEVHSIQDLSDFWLDSNLIENPQGSHPYQSNIPSDLLGKARWFLLDANTNAKVTGQLNQILNVYAIALYNQKTNRRLLYVYAPQGETKNINIKIPSYGSVSVDADQKGVFYILDGAQIRKITTSQRYNACRP